MKKYPMLIESDSDHGQENDNYNFDANGNQIEGLNVDITRDYDDNSSKLDSKYICPITKELMKSPVIAYDNCVYEKEAIIEYLRKYRTTPKQKNAKLQTQEEVEQVIQMLFDHHELKAEMQKRLLN